MEHGFSWIGTIPGLRDLPNHSVTATLVAILVLGRRVGRTPRPRSAEEPLVPDGRPSARELFEVITAFVDNMADGMIGHGTADNTYRCSPPCSRSSCSRI